MADTNSRVLSVLPVFAHGLVHGHYNLHQYCHSLGSRLIAAEILPCWLYIYASKAAAIPPVFKSMAECVMDADESGTSMALGAVVGAVFVQEISASAATARFPLLPLLQNSSQVLLVQERVCFDPPVYELDFVYQRHDAWVSLSPGTMRCLEQEFIRCNTEVPVGRHEMSQVTCEIQMPFAYVDPVTTGIDLDGRILYSRRRLAKIMQCRPDQVAMNMGNLSLDYKEGYFYLSVFRGSARCSVQAFACEDGTASDDEDATTVTTSSCDETPSAPTYEHPDDAARYAVLAHRAKPKDKYFRRDTRRYYFLDEEGRMWCKKQQRDQYLSTARQLLAQIAPNRLVVPSRTEMVQICCAYHDRAHDGRDRLMYALGNYYKFRGLRDVVEEVIKACTRCSEFSKRYPKLVQAIITSRPMELVMFDLTAMPANAPDGSKWILTIKDHFTKYAWALVLKDKTMEVVTDALFQVFKCTPVPERWHCDNGSEFINQCMQAVRERLGAVPLTRGRPRNPQTQGLIERFNGTLKEKLIKKLVDDGLVVPGQTIPMVRRLDDLLLHENDAPIALYNGISAFVALHGAPRAAPDCPKLSGPAIEAMHSFMYDCQVTRAGRRCQFPVLEELLHGCVVHVRATAKELKDKIAVGPWTQRAVVHGVSPKSEHYFKLRWLTANSGPNVPGSLSTRYVGRHDLRLAAGEEARVYVAEHGNVIITDSFPDDTCNYVYLDGEYKGTMYSSETTMFVDADRVPYTQLYPPPEPAEVAPVDEVPGEPVPLEPVEQCSDDELLLDAYARQNSSKKRRTEAGTTSPATGSIRSRTKVPRVSKATATTSSNVRRGLSSKAGPKKEPARVARTVGASRKRGGVVRRTTVGTRGDPFVLGPSVARPTTNVGSTEYPVYSKTKAVDVANNRMYLLDKLRKDLTPRKGRGWMPFLTWHGNSCHFDSLALCVLFGLFFPCVGVDRWMAAYFALGAARPLQLFIDFLANLDGASQGSINERRQKVSCSVEIQIRALWL